MDLLPAKSLFFIYLFIYLFIHSFILNKAPFFSSGTLHGIVIWMEFHLTDDITVTTGLQTVTFFTPVSHSSLSE